MKIQFVYGEGPGTYSNGDTIPGRLAVSVITRVENELIPITDKVTELITVIDSVVTSINEVMNPEFTADLRSGVASLSNTAKSIEEAELKSTLQNINAFTQMLAENSGRMTSAFSSLETVADTLAAADIYSSVNNLKVSLEKAGVLMENLNSGQGTAGKLMTNDSLYQNLSNSLESLNLLLLDLKANPKRYVNFSVFGKKNVPEE